MDNRDLEFHEWELWSEYTDKIDDLHRRSVLADPTKKRGYVYIARMDIHGHSDPDGSAHIKIGRAKSPKQRIRDWSRTHVVMPYEIRESASFWCDDAAFVERYFHDLFKKFRETGEWFWMPFEYQHALWGVWYVVTHGEASNREISIRDYAGRWLSPREYLLEELRYLRKLKEQQDEERRYQS